MNEVWNVSQENYFGLEKQWESPGYTFPPPTEPTQPALKALLFIFIFFKKKSGMGEKSDFDLGKPEGERMGKEVR